MHITPAFFFPHVVFVDQDPAAMAFFSNHAAILDTVKQRRTYRRSPYVQFIYQDFTQPLPLLQNQFDLLLALFTGGVSQACKPYLRKGGLLLTNDHEHDALQADQDGDLELLAIIEQQQGKYRLVDQSPGELSGFQKAERRPKNYLRQTSKGVEYIEQERYYLFRRK